MNLRDTRHWRATLLLCVLAFGPQEGSAQFAVDWFTVDGGGMSAGGGYSVSGTVGQVDAGPILAGDNFTVTGGFWGLVETPDAPLLKIHRDGMKVTISWPNPSTGFVLQETTQLGSPPSMNVWTDVALVPTEVGPEKSVLMPASTNHRFFRLRRR